MSSVQLNGPATLPEEFLFVTLDSLRFDVASAAMSEGRTPQLARIVSRWERREAAATYTLPSHIAMFAGGMPRLPRAGVDGPENRLFALRTSRNRGPRPHVRYFFDDAPNVPRGFRAAGYRTIGVGGVGWFSTERQASSFWADQYFQEFLYKPSYGEEHRDAFAEQIYDLSRVLQNRRDEPLFVFINVSATHLPYVNGDGTRSCAAQLMCLEYVDRNMPSLMSLFGPTVEGVICADHGDCMGEDGLWGHSSVHEKVLTVPYAEFGCRAAAG